MLSVVKAHGSTPNDSLIDEIVREGAGGCWPPPSERAVA